MNTDNMTALEALLFQIKTMIHIASDDSLAAEKYGMVYQLWEDGEITLQKCGALLWQRSLHSTKPGFPKGVPVDYFPHQHNGHGYVFCTDQHASVLHDYIGRYASHPDHGGN